MAAKIPAYTDIGKSTRGKWPFKHQLAYVSIQRSCLTLKRLTRAEASLSAETCHTLLIDYLARDIADLLGGGGVTGVYQFNNVFSLSSKTADGVVSYSHAYNDGFTSSWSPLLHLPVLQGPLRHLTRVTFLLGVHSYQYPERRRSGNYCESRLRHQGLQLQRQRASRWQGQSAHDSCFTFSLLLLAT